MSSPSEFDLENWKYENARLLTQVSVQSKLIEELCKVHLVLQEANDKKRAIMGAYARTTLVNEGVIKAQKQIIAMHEQFRKDVEEMATTDDIKQLLLTGEKHEN